MYFRTKFRVSFLIALFLVFFIPACLFAAALSSRRDIMSRNQISVSSNHEIQFTSPSGVDASSDTIIITFPSGFSFGTVAFGDVDLFHGPSTGFETNETLAASASAGVWGVSVSGNIVTFTAPTNAGAGEIAAGDKVVIRVGTNAAGGTNQVTNPSTAGVYTLSISGTFGDSGNLSLPIAQSDRISVTLSIPAPSTGLTGGGSGGGESGIDGSSPSIVGIQVRNLTPIGAEIVWSTDEPANSIVQYGFTNTYGSGTVSNAALVTSHSIILSELSPDTTYHFRIRSNDAANNTVVSSNASFRTLLPPRFPIISNRRVVERTDTSSLILWDTDIPATSVVEYGTSTSYGSIASSRSLMTSHALALSGLGQNTLFHYRTISVEAGGLTTTSTNATFSTLPDATPPTNVFNLHVSTDQQRVVLSWTLPTDPDFDRVIVVVRTNRPPQGPTDGRIVYSGTGTSTADSILTAGTLGYYVAYAMDRSGNPSSGSFVQATPQGRPSVVVTVPLLPSEPAAPLPSISPSPTQVFMLPIASTATLGVLSVPPISVSGEPGTGIATTTEPVAFLPLTTTTVTIPLPSLAAETTTASVFEELPIGAAAKPRFYFVGGNLELEQDENGVFSLVASKSLLLKISTVGLPATPVAGSVVVGDSTYGLSHSPDGFSFEATFVPGLRTGDVSIVSTIQLANNQRITVRQTARLVGLGRIREKAVFGKGQAVVGASVFVERVIDRRAARWDPIGTNQKNPDVSAADGSFGFVVPNGRYRLRVAKDGYRPFSKDIVVTKNVINEIVELTKAPKPFLSVINPDAPLLKNVAAVAEQIQIRVQSPENQAVTKAVVAPTVATVAVVNAASAVSAFNLFNYLRFFLTQPLLFLFRKKRQKWGIVFNALSKRPVDLAIVRLLRAQTNLVVQTRITDALGRFTFIVSPGDYHLQVVKPQFTYPTVVMSHVKEDAGFLDLYHGEVISVTAQSALTPNIPMDPIVKEETPRSILLKQVLRKIQRGAGGLSTMVSIGAVFVVPTPAMAIFATAQVGLYLLFRRLGVAPKPKGWGIVFDQVTNERLGRAVVRIFNKKYNKLLETQMTDENGRYGFVVGKDVYYLVADHPKYERYVSPEIDLVQSKENLIDHKILLKKKGTVSPQVVHNGEEKGDNKN